MTAGKASLVEEGGDLAQPFGEAFDLQEEGIVLAPRRENEPAIVAVPVDARTDWGVALFAYLVSMTPGSTCLHVADDRRTLYVHFLDAPNRQARAADSKRPLTGIDAL